MLTAFSVIILILTLIVTPFMLSINLKDDLLANKGEIKVSLFFIPVVKAEIMLESVGTTEKNIVITSGKKRDEIHLNTDKNDKKSIVALFKAAPIMSYLTVERLETEASIGFVSDAFATTMTVGVLRTFLGAVTSFLKSRQNIEIRSAIMPSYNKNELDFKIFGILKLSLANIINGFIAGLLNKFEVKAKQNGKLKTKAAKVRL